MNCTIIFAMILGTLALSQSLPIDSNNPYQGIHSNVDLSGQQVRQKRENDYFICYPSSVVYGYHSNSNSLDTHRRSSESSNRNSYYNSFDARKERADRERAAYVDSFGR